MSRYLIDTDDHETLLSKLSHYGIVCGNASKWFKSYLENRTQMCSINELLSNNLSLTCGVPEETIHGSLLFLLYINDLPNCLSNCEPRMYADDTHLTYAGDCVDNLHFYLKRVIVSQSSVIFKSRLRKCSHLVESEQTYSEYH